MNKNSKENPVNSRILLLKSKLNLGQNEFCQKTEISTATLYSIQKGAVIRTKTAKSIAEKLGANPNWLLTGEGDLFSKQVENELNPYKEALVSELKQQVEYLKEMLRLAIGGGGGGSANFLQLVNKTAFEPFLMAA